MTSSIRKPIGKNSLEINYESSIRKTIEQLLRLGVIEFRTSNNNYAFKPTCIIVNGRKGFRRIELEEVGKLKHRKQLDKNLRNILKQVESTKRPLGEAIVFVDNNRFVLYDPILSYGFSKSFHTIDFRIDDQDHLTISLNGSPNNPSPLTYNIPTDVKHLYHEICKAIIAYNTKTS